MAEPSAGPDLVTIETPEHVVVQYEIAGLMSRGLAVFFDHVIQTVVLLIIIVSVLFALGGTSVIEGGLGKEMQMAALGAGLLAYFILFWGYFVLFELFWRGQTPGKRLVGIRVIRDGGYGVTFTSVLVRNLFRMIPVPGDLGPFYPLGAVVMFMNRRAKRLGDYAAGTIVVRDQPASLRPIAAVGLRPGAVDEALVAELRRSGIHRLREEQVRLVDDYLARRFQFDPASRARNARLIADPIGRAVSVEIHDPERFLENVKAALRKGDGA